MGDPHIKILKKRIAKLDQEDFDLEAWKDATKSILDKMLDPDDKRIRLIDQLKVDYGSWALRDATSKYNPIETAKKKGKELLESIVDEFESKDDRVLMPFSREVIKQINEATSKSEIIKIFKKEKKEILAEALSELLFKDLKRQ